MLKKLMLLTSMAALAIVVSAPAAQADTISIKDQNGKALQGVELSGYISFSNWTCNDFSLSGDITGNGTEEIQVSISDVEINDCPFWTGGSVNYSNEAAGDLVLRADGTAEVGLEFDRKVPIPQPTCHGTADLWSEWLIDGSSVDLEGETSESGCWPGVQAAVSALSLTDANGNPATLTIE